MQRYKNIGGDSGVAAYQIGSDFIQVRFADGMVYTYDYWRAGSSHVDRMKDLARAGRGLNSYINRHVKMLYSSKSRGGFDFANP